MQTLKPLIDANGTLMSRIGNTVIPFVYRPAASSFAAWQAGACGWAIKDVLRCKGSDSRDRLIQGGYNWGLGINLGLSLFCIPVSDAPSHAVSKQCIFRGDRVIARLRADSPRDALSVDSPANLGQRPSFWQV